MNVTVTLYATHPDYAPKRGTPHSTGLDLVASEMAIIRPGRVRRVPTGISVHVAAPEGVRVLDLQVRGRSGMASKGYFLHVGTVDLDYRGPMDVIMYNATRDDLVIRQGDRVGQLIVPEFAIAHERETWVGFEPWRVVPVDIVHAIGVAPIDTQRGAGGYGSTGA